MKRLKQFLPFLSIFVIIWILFHSVFMLAIIPSESMEDTIMTGDLLFATRYNADQVERYDIVVFQSPDEPETYFIKRVIGLPGETIKVKEGHVYADDRLLDESFLKEKMDTLGDGIYEVPEGCYFMMGDNRNNSVDSRFWKNKYVSSELLKAKAVFRILPFSSIGNIE